MNTQIKIFKSLAAALREEYDTTVINTISTEMLSMDDWYKAIYGSDYKDDPANAYFFAKYILQGRNIEGEECIMNSSLRDAYLEHLKDVLTTQEIAEILLKY